MRAAKSAENVVRSWWLADVDEEKIDNLAENVTAQGRKLNKIEDEARPGCR